MIYKSNFEHNLLIYFKRLCFDFHLALNNGDLRGMHYASLAHSLRCITDISKQIDRLLEQKEYELIFPFISNLTAMKKKTIGDSTFFFEEHTSKGIIFNQSFSFRVITDDEFDEMKIVPPIYVDKVQSLTNWLACIVAEFWDDGKKHSISRVKMIKRISNRFGGSHPIESEYKDKEESDYELVNKYIDNLMTVKTDGVYAGNTFIQECVYDFIKAFLPFYEEISNDDVLIKAIKDEIKKLR